MYKVMQNRIQQEIEEANFVAVIGDDTSDVSNHLQIVVGENECAVAEHFQHLVGALLFIGFRRSPKSSLQQEPFEEIITFEILQIETILGEIFHWTKSCLFRI